MGKTNKLPKPTLAESKAAVAFGVAFLDVCRRGLRGLRGLPRFITRLSSARSEPNPGLLQASKDAMPFPQTLDPAPFQIANIREAYSVAKQTPDFLAQQPCYCYCQRMGHRNVLDCFTSLHSTRCDIWINEATQLRNGQARASFQALCLVSLRWRDGLFFSIICIRTDAYPRPPRLIEDSASPLAGVCASMKLA
jgi:Protein of unknown function with PCYCGC motif